MAPAAGSTGRAAAGRRLAAADEALLRELIDRLVKADRGLREAEANWHTAKNAFIAYAGKPDPKNPLKTLDWLNRKTQRPDLSYWWGCVADYHHEIAAIAAEISAFIAAIEALGYRVPDHLRHVPRAR